jgi:hypothetical protein
MGVTSPLSPHPVLNKEHNRLTRQLFTMCSQPSQLIFPFAIEYYKV